MAAYLSRSSIFYMPFRGIAKLTGGAVNMDMARALVVMVNGQFFRGLRAFWRARTPQTRG